MIQAVPELCNQEGDFNGQKKRRAKAGVGKNLNKVSTNADSIADQTEDKLDDFIDKAEG